jgi:hypothetical protein
MPTAAVWLPLHDAVMPLAVMPLLPTTLDTPVKAPPLIVSAIVNCPPCVPAGTWTGEEKTHDRLPSVNPLIPIPPLDGLLMSNVKVELFVLTPVNPTACTCSVAVFDAEPAKPKTHTATATASAIATAMSIIVATTFDIPFLFMFVFIRWFLLSTT